MLGLLTLALVCASGCTSISLESNKDAAAVHKVNRLFILIRQDDVKTRQLANDLAVDCGICFSNRPTRIEVAIISPLDLDDSGYNRRISAFDSDSVLTIAIRTAMLDQSGGFRTINYDVSLFDPATKKRLWRAAVVNSGSPEIMEKRMRKMVEAIVSKLDEDGFL